MMRSVSLLWGRNLIEREEADKEKRTCTGTSFGGEGSLIVPANTTNLS